MKDHGKELSPECIKALEDAGEVTPEEIRMKRRPELRFPVRFSLNNSTGSCPSGDQAERESETGARR